MRCFRLSAPVLFAGDGLASRAREPPNDFPLSGLFLVPLAMALPQMLEKIEAELVDKTVGATEISRVLHRTELMCELLTAGGHLSRRDLDRGLLLGSRSSGVGGLAGDGGAGAIGPNLARMLRKVRMRGDSG